MSGESHRIYWQQWASKEHAASSAAASTTTTATRTTTASATGGGGGATPTALLPRSRRELITSSAAVRITPQAQAKDVTDLLRQSLQLEGDPDPTSGLSESLVLVGTLFSLPPHFVVFEHEILLQQLREASNERQSTSTTGEATVRIAGSHPSTTVPHQSSTGAGTGVSPPPHRHDPFHVIRTLQPHENPLTVRDRMVERLRQLQNLAPTSRTIISPKLQFFYVHPTPQTSSCIELDGYSTSMEDEDEDGSYYEDDVDPEEELHGSFSDESDDPEGPEMHAEMCRRFPWLATPSIPESEAPSVPADKSRRRRDVRFRRYLAQATAHPATFLSGFLLKQSQDPHVWRRVHCALTEDRLWFASRVYQHGSVACESTDGGRAQHGSLRLTRALLIPADAGPAESRSSPNRALRSTPWAFELVSGRGTSHVFRATTQGSYTSWIRALRARIALSEDNTLVDHAELLLADESVARTHRVTACAVVPLWEALQARSSIADGGSNTAFWDPRRRNASASGAPDDGLPVGSVLRWGLQVAEFRESCRDLHARLPPKRHVVATTTTMTSSPLPTAASQALHPHRTLTASPPGIAPEPPDATNPASEIPVNEPLEPYLWHRIQGAWDVAAKLLSQAEQLGRDILLLQQQRQEQPQQQQAKGAQSPPPQSNAASNNGLHHPQQQRKNSLLLSSLETHCRHVEYLITGRFRSLGNSGNNHGRAANLPPEPLPPPLPLPAHPPHRDPPPLDLFESLLRDLQVHAAEASASTSTAAATASANGSSY